MDVEATQAGPISVRIELDPETFCEELYPQLVGLISLHAHSPDRSEDLAQEALIKALERWPAVSTMDNPRGWVVRVALNLANSSLRRAAAESRAYRKIVRHSRQTGRATDEDVVDRLLVVNALRGLSAKQRAVVLLRYFLGMSVAETASTLDCSESSVKTHTSRALDHLRDTTHFSDLME